MNDVIEIFHDVDLRNGHDGLANWTDKNGGQRVKFDKLKTGQWLVFVNTEKSAFKFMVGTDEPNVTPILGHQKSTHGRLEMRAIKYIPQCFNGGKLNWNKATEHALTELLPEKKVKNER